MKKVSVIIPAYNHAEFIGEAIASVLDSDYKNIEVIVIDDGSKDRTREIVSKFREVYYVYQENQGAHSAINNGFALASGEYLAVLNDDDRYSPEHLALALENMLTYGNDFFIGKPRIVGSGVKFDALTFHVEEGKRMIEKMGLGKSLFKINWTISTSAFVFNRHLHDRIGGFHNFALCHDLDFLIRALFIGETKIGVSEKPTWDYRCHGTNSGSSVAIEKQGAEIVYSLGRALDRVIEEELSLELSSMIGHGINSELKLRAMRERPWRNEAHIGIDESIQRWIKSCLRATT